MKHFHFITIVFVASTLISNASIKYVPSDYLTIQLAIDNSSNGDSIIVNEGIYQENIVIDNKNIVLGSKFLMTNDTSFISKTVINGNKKGSVLSLLRGSQSGTCIAGFTLTNGSGKMDFFIDHGIVWDTVYYGGGIYVGDSCSPHLEYLRIYKNKADYGGGIFVNSGSPIINNVHIDSNCATDKGGGFFSESSRKNGLNITSSKITNNIASRGGGIDYMSGFDDRCLYLRDTEISNNTATYKGQYGYESGAAMYGGSAKFILENVTIANNKGLTDFCMANYVLEIHNSIIYKTKIYLYSQHDTIESTIIDYSDIENGKNNFILDNAKLTWGDGNITANPQFINEQNSNYHLKSNSPCIDNGDPDVNYNDENGSRNDIGAYEFRLSNNVVTIDNSSDFIIYPNPFSDILNIKSDRMIIKSISIYDINGLQLLYKSSVDNSRIDLRFLKSSIYFLVIKTGNSIYNYKILKK